MKTSCRQIELLNRRVASQLDGIEPEPHNSVNRAGATLTEVLMSLMIMSIGVVSVATLFPIASLRTLEANKQTNSTISRFNAEALIDVDPEFIHNPDAFWPPGGPNDTTPYNGTAFRAKNYMVDPLGWQEFNYDPATPSNPQAPSPLIAVFPTGNTPRDYFGTNVPTVVTSPAPRRYTGASLFTTPYATTAAQLVAARMRAAELVTQPDNWKLVAESQVISAAPATGITSVTLELDVDLSAASEDSNANGVLDPGEDRNSNGVIDLLQGTRVVLYDVDGTHSEVRQSCTNPAPGSIAWTTPLPAWFNTTPSGSPMNLGKVRIEQFDRIYTWMLSVRKRPSGQANIDVVVFFKRNFADPNHERVFVAEFRKWTLGPNGVPGGVGNDNGAGPAEDVNELGFPGSDDVRNGTVTLKFPSVATDEERPKPRRGGYIYDTKNGLWYRIRAVQNEQFGITGASGLEDWVDVVLDEAIKLDNTEDLNGNGTLDAALGEDLNGNGVLDQGGAILLPSVANVFPLEIKEP